MATPSNRLQTFANGDTISAEFLNEWLQDYIIANAAAIETHGGDGVDPHGSDMIISGTLTVGALAFTSTNRTRLMALTGFLGSDKTDLTMAADDGGLASADNDLLSNHYAYAALPPYIKPGDVFQALTVRGRVEVGADLELVLFEKQGAVATALATLTLDSANLTDTESDLALTIASDKTYYLRARFFNNNIDSAVKIDEIELNWDDNGL